MEVGSPKIDARVDENENDLLLKEKMRIIEQLFGVERVDEFEKERKHVRMGRK